MPDQIPVERTAETIFNDILERPPDSPIEFERIHRALRLRGRENDPPRDIICCLVNFPLKEAILRKAREKNRVIFNGTEIKLYQDLSNITLQQRRALRPITEQLRSRGIPYRWKFPFCLSATSRGHTALLRTPDDLRAFCEAMNIPRTEVPEWYNSFMLNESWITLSDNLTPRTQRQRERRPRSPSPQRNRRADSDAEIDPIIKTIWTPKPCLKSRR